MLHIDTTALDELHNVNRNAIVRMPPALLSPDLRDLVGDDGGDVAGGDAAEHGLDFADEVLDREEAGDRDQREQRRKQRKEEVVGLLRRQIEHIVRERLVEGAFEQLATSSGECGSVPAWRCG